MTNSKKTKIEPTLEQQISITGKQAETAYKKVLENIEFFKDHGLNYGTCMPGVAVLDYPDTTDLIEALQEFQSVSKELSIAVSNYNKNTPAYTEADS